MSYQVLARKWRPTNFSQVAGQEYIVHTLINALKMGRIHHAYLFSGTHGTGKTTIARILNKCLNCDRGVTPNPCQECNTCQAINENTFLDLVEVDAASRTGVDDMREMLEKTSFVPATGRFRTYLIDEVHMLSTSSFNALLKTLEEPLAHVKFILATTHPHKIPPTVLSRCLQFHLTKIPLAKVENQLKHILEEERIAYESPAIHEIALTAQGSMRDALSLLDQMIAYGNGKVSNKDAVLLLGLTARKHLPKLLKTIIQGPAQEVLQEIETLDSLGANLRVVTDDMLDLVHQVNLRMIVPKAVTGDKFGSEEILELTKISTPENMQLYHQMILNTKRDLMFFPDMRSAIEMLSLRMKYFSLCQEDDIKHPAKTVEPNKTQLPLPHKNRILNLASAISTKTPSSEASPSTPVPQSTTKRYHHPSQNKESLPQVADSLPMDAYQNNPRAWLHLVESLELRGPSLQICHNASLVISGENEIYLILEEEKKFLINNSRKSSIEKALRRALAREDLKLQIKVDSAVQDNIRQYLEKEGSKKKDKLVAKYMQDPTVSLLQEKMGGIVRQESIREVAQDGKSQLRK